MEYEPILLILREDNLPAAITAVQSGNWRIYRGDASFEFLKDLSNFDLRDFLIKKAGAYPVSR
jgi:hypothetical protein